MFYGMIPVQHFHPVGEMQPKLAPVGGRAISQAHHQLLHRVNAPRYCLPVQPCPSLLHRPRLRQAALGRGLPSRHLCPLPLGFSPKDHSRLHIMPAILKAHPGGVQRHRSYSGASRRSSPVHRRLPLSLLAGFQRFTTAFRQPFRFPGRDGDPGKLGETLGS